MNKGTSRWLLAGAIGSGLAAMLHLGCIVFGGDWYRFFGAGEQMAQMAEAGHWYPTLVTSGIVGVLALWSLYGFSGAQLIARMPLLRWVLLAIAAIYLIRSVSPIALIPMFPDNSIAFWVISSLVCFAIGLCYAIGTVKAWPQLAKP